MTGHAAADETPAYIGALAAYAEDKLLGEKELLRIIEACEQGAIVNPFAREGAELDTAKWHAYETLEEFVKHGNLIAAQVCAWAKKMGGELARAHGARAQTQEETALAWGETNPTLGVGGGGNVCGIQTNGTLMCWERGRECYPPDGLGAVISLSISSNAVCVLLADGTVRCLVAKGDDKCTLVYSSLDDAIPKELGKALFVAVGHGVACAIKADRTLACWSDLGVENIVPPGLGLVVSVSVANGEYGERICAVKTNSEIICWNQDGEITPTPSSFARSISSGRFSCTVTMDSLVECFAVDGRPLQIRKNPGIVSAVSVGGSYSLRWIQFACAITASRELNCWDADGSPAEAIKGEVLFVSVNGVYGCALLKNRTVTCWQFTSHAPAIDAELSRKNLRFKYDNE
jgi:hypothetical protein